MRQGAYSDIKWQKYSFILKLYICSWKINILYFIGRYCRPTFVLAEDAGHFFLIGITELLTFLLLIRRISRTAVKMTLVINKIGYPLTSQG